MTISIEGCVEEKLNWRYYVTPKYTRARPIYNWFVYPHSFDKLLVDELIVEFGLTKNSLIWDPFLGAGTMALACKENGISAYGSDLLPLSMIVSQAKISDYKVENLKTISSKFNLFPPSSIKDRFADIPIVEKTISKEIREFFSHVLCQVEELDTELHPFFLTAIVSILESASKSVKSGGWLRIDPSKEISITTAQSLFSKRIEQMICDIEQQPEKAKFSENEPQFCLWVGDARFSKPEKEVDAIITSPPYLNRHDYTRVFALELSLIGVTNSQELKDLRYQTLRSHVEAKNQLNDKSIDEMGYQKPAIITQAIDQMKTNGLTDARVPKMIEGYFEDMFLVLKNTYDALADGGKAAFVLGDVRFSGVMIPVTEIICEIGTTVGFTVRKVFIARYRGNSAQQMGNYGRVKSKESVIILGK